MILSRSKPPIQPAADNFGYLQDDEIYLDSACQTLRPQAVIEAIDEYYHKYNSCGDRVKYEWGLKVDEAIGHTREKLLKLAGKSDRDYACSFTLNTTYGINLILSQLPKGNFQQIITSETEHNSVFLPSIAYAKKLGLNRAVLPRQKDGALIYEPQQLEKAIVLVNTTSNVDGSNLVNARQLADDAHQHGGIVIFDAAQTMGHYPEIISAVDFDAICFSGHKMYGPSLGVIIIKRKLLDLLSISFIGGGTVEDVEKDEYRLIRDDPATRLEAGLQNFSGIIGLGAALDWRQKYRPEGMDPKEHQQSLAKKLYDGVKNIPGVTMLNQSPSPILSFYADRIDAHKLAIYLSGQNIMARSGYFCCHYYLDHVKHYPPMLRLSLGLNNTEAQIDKTIAAMQKLVGAAG